MSDDSNMCRSFEMLKAILNNNMFNDLCYRVARKLIDEPAAEGKESPRKRGNEDQVQSASKKNRAEYDLESPPSMQTKSFYSGKNTNYMTPLERKNVRESAGVRMSPRLRIAKENEYQQNKKQALKQTKGKPTKAKKSIVVKSEVTVKSKPLAVKKEPLGEIAPGSPRSAVVNVSQSPEGSTGSSASSQKKFFKSRTPQLVKSKASGGAGSSSKMTKKGLQMVYKPASMKNKVTPRSPDIKLFKRNPAAKSPGLGFKPSNIFANSPKSPSLLSPRRSPRKQINSPLSIRSEELFSSNATSVSEENVEPLIESPESTSTKLTENDSPGVSSVTDSVNLMSEPDSTELNLENSPGIKLLLDLLTLDRVITHRNRKNCLVELIIHVVFSTFIWKTFLIFEPTCAYCTGGSHASLSVRLSVRLSVTRK